MQMQLIKIYNKTFKQLSYYKIGVGPTLLLVHGFPANVHLWRFIVPQLAQKYTLLLPDFFGESGDWLEEGYTSMDLLADAFMDILQHEGVKKVLYAGHSMGGYMGLAFAAKYPECLLGLSLIHSAPLADDPQRAEGRRKTILILEKGGKNLFLKKMVKALFPETFNLAYPELVARQTEEALNVPVEGLVAFYRAIMERRETKEIVFAANFPIQHIVGKLDSLANITKELSPESLSSRNFVHIYNGVGHMAMLEVPEMLTKDLLHFLNYSVRLQTD